MTKEDAIINTVSIGAITTYLMEIEIVLTVLVLTTALTLNIYKLIKHWNERNDDRQSS